MTDARGLTIALALSAAFGGCSNAGEDRILSIPGGGIVAGVVYLDRDGDRAPGGADAALAGVRVRLVVAGTRDTVASASSGADGGFAFGRVPVGQYRVVVPGEAIVGDSISVVRLDTSEVSIAPEDTVEIEVTVSFPRVSIAEARTIALGTKVFVDGVGLNFRDVFGDTTLHLRDTSAAIRITGTQGPLVTAGDSVRVLGRLSARSGQPVIDQGQVTIITVVGQPVPVAVTTAQAAGADGGVLDADLVKVANATIADTSTVGGDYIARVNDGSGLVAVVFDQDAAIIRTAYVPGVIIDATGVLVPDGSGAWRIKPRAAADLIVK